MGNGKAKLTAEQLLAEADNYRKTLEMLASRQEAYDRELAAVDGERLDLLARIADLQPKIDEIVAAKRKEQEMVALAEEGLSDLLASNDYKAAVLERAVKVERSLWAERDAAVGEARKWEAKAQEYGTACDERDREIAELRKRAEKAERERDALRDGKDVL